MLENLLAFVVMVGGLVFVHELGHFVAGKLFGIPVLTFALGFGPRLLSVRLGETEYQLCALPLGGWVRFAGDDDAPHRSFNAHPLWQRLLAVLAGPAANLALPLGLYLLANLQPKDVPAPVVGLVLPASPAADAGLRPGDRIDSVDGAPVADFPEIVRRVQARAGRATVLGVRRGADLRSVTVTPSAEAGWLGVTPQALLPVVAVDPAAEALTTLRTGDEVRVLDGRPLAHAGDLAAALGAGAHRGLAVRPHARHAGPLELGLGEPFAFELPAEAVAAVRPAGNLVAAVEPESPAGLAGLRAGDFVATLDGQPVQALDLAAARVAQAPGAHAVTYERAGAEHGCTLEVARGREAGVGLAGLPGLLGADDVPRAQTLAAAWARARSDYRAALGTLGDIVAMLVSGELALGSIGGPLMLFEVAARSAAVGLELILVNTAFISLNLALLNLLPVPVLDGGHLVFFAYEAARRRPPGHRVREIANVLGALLLGILMLLAFKNDIVRSFFGK